MGKMKVITQSQSVGAPLTERGKRALGEATKTEKTQLCVWVDAKGYARFKAAIALTRKNATQEINRFICEYTNKEDKR